MLSKMILGIKRPNLSLTSKLILVSALFFVLFAVILISITNSIITDNLQKQTQKLTEEYILSEVDEHLDPSLFVHKERSKSEIEMEHHRFNPFFKAIKSTEVSKIKMWDNEATIIHVHNSFSEEIDFDEINKSYTDNKSYMAAIGGQVNTEIISLTDGDTEGEAGSEQLLKIYVPVYLSGQENPVGVAEIFYNLDLINEQILIVNRLIILVISIGFIVLFFILAVLTKTTSDTLIRKEKEVEKAHQIDLDRVKEIVRLKDEFVFLVVHDLRTPVTVINLYLEELLKTGEKSIKEGEYIGVIKAANERLRVLINNLLEYTKIKSGVMKVDLVPVSINDVITKVVSGIQSLAEQKHVAISSEFEADYKVLADMGMLEETLENLLSNAAKYNQIGGSIKIKSSLRDDYVQIDIIDNGLGISKENQSKVFQKFVRFDATQRGSGLGLFITNNLIEKMQGKIWFESTKGKGTTFSFTLKRV